MMLTMETTLIKNTYHVTGMTCEACEYKVKTVLGKIAGVQGVTIDLKTGETTLETERKIPLSELKEVLKPHSKYQIERHFPLHAKEPMLVGTPLTEPERTFLETYKPLLLIAAFIAGVSLLTSFHAGIYQWAHFSIVMFLHNFMTGFFLVFSFFKLLNLNDFANSFAMYDLAAMRFPIYGKIYPFLELGLGILCLAHIEPRLVYLADILLMGFGNLGVIQSVMNKRKIKCACLGAVFNLPMSTVTIIENTIMVALGVILLLLTSNF